MPAYSREAFNGEHGQFDHLTQEEHLRRAAEEAAEREDRDEEGFRKKFGPRLQVVSNYVLVYVVVAWGLCVLVGLFLPNEGLIGLVIAIGIMAIGLAGFGFFNHSSVVIPEHERVARAARGGRRGRRPSIGTLLERV